jgi:hypothetical protein
MEEESQEETDEETNHEVEVPIIIKNRGPSQAEGKGRKQ